MNSLASADWKGFAAFEDDDLTRSRVVVLDCFLVSGSVWSFRSMNHVSQFGEDRILDKVFAGKSKGFCVEVGANDGVNDSTTFFFEKKGWECLLIEPNPELCRQIRQARKSKLMECAVSDQSGEVSLFIAEGAPRAHGVSTIHGGQVGLEKIRSYGFSGREVRVRARTLDEVLREFAPSQPVDFISIDVEGHELSVLQGLSLNAWRPRILLLEDNAGFRDASVRNYLKDRGYVVFKRTGVNDWYARSEDAELVNLISRAQYAIRFAIGRTRSLLGSWKRRAIALAYGNAAVEQNGNSQRSAGDK